MSHIPNASVTGIKCRNTSNRCLKDGSLLVKGAEVMMSDSSDGSSSSFPKIQLPFDRS